MSAIQLIVHTLNWNFAKSSSKIPFGINHLLDSPKSESDVNEFLAKFDAKLEELLSFLKDFSMLDSFMNDPDVLINFPPTKRGRDAIS